ncbi:MAG: hypothetical protein AAGN66_06995 [Acidobacteriota bacterium]
MRNVIRGAALVAVLILTTGCWATELASLLVQPGPPECNNEGGVVVSDVEPFEVDVSPGKVFLASLNGVQVPMICRAAETARDCAGFQRLDPIWVEAGTWRNCDVTIDGQRYGRCVEAKDIRLRVRRR